MNLKTQNFIFCDSYLCTFHYLIYHDLHGFGFCDTFNLSYSLCINVSGEGEKRDGRIRGQIIDWLLSATNSLISFQVVLIILSVNPFPIGEKVVNSHMRWATSQLNTHSTFTYAHNAHNIVYIYTYTCFILQFILRHLPTTMLYFVRILYLCNKCSMTDGQILWPKHVEVR